MPMQSYFYALAEYAERRLREQEVLLSSLRAETSDFVRFNRGRVRQAGQVRQMVLRLELVVGTRHACSEVTLTQEPDLDRVTVAQTLDWLRAALPQLPEDPHLAYATSVQSSSDVQESRLPERGAALDAILAAADDDDAELVGIYAAGACHAGFANSLGQRNWFTRYTFNFDWSLFVGADQAVKCNYAGISWDERAFAAKVARAKEQGELLRRPPVALDPGEYRAYLAPAAVYDVLQLLGWGGFGLKHLRTKQTPLLQLADGRAGLAPAVSLRENVREGLAPNFDAYGYVKPEQVELIRGGKHAGCVVSARSAREYEQPTTAASPDEVPQALELDGGELQTEQVLATLGDGLYVGNVWYLNYSDRTKGRITGMTRFATFVVRGGELLAPARVMRFDDTIYRMFGSELQALSRERELIVDPESYGWRATKSAVVPGLLVRALALTL